MDGSKGYEQRGGTARGLAICLLRNVCLLESQILIMATFSQQGFGLGLFRGCL